MASRTKQKEEARARRLAEEQARTESARRQRRLQMLGGVLIAAIAVIAVAIAVSSSGGGTNVSTAAYKGAASTVDSQLAGIPQSANRLGSPTAKVVVTEYGDLQCPICRDFALGAESQLIANEVKTGKVALVYRSLETATGNGANPAIFPTQQAAASAAGLQGKAWNYILVFYHVQGQEGTNYVTATFLDGIAKSIAGLNFAKWQSAAGSSTLSAQVQADQQQAQAQGFNSTPTIVVKGPKGAAPPIVGTTDYGSLQSAIKRVS
jgi:protein-disulfide isomerase